MKFLKRWFGLNKDRVMEEPIPYVEMRTGFGRFKQQSYCDLLQYVLYLNAYAGTAAQQPTGPDWYKWWETELFKVVEGPTVYVGKAKEALEYLFRINFEDHGKFVPEALKEKAHERLKLGTG